MNHVQKHELFEASGVGEFGEFAGISRAHFPVKLIMRLLRDNLTACERQV